MIRLTSVTEKLGNGKDDFLLYLSISNVFAVNSRIHMDVIKNSFNAVKTLTVTTFLEVNGVNR